MSITIATQNRRFSLKAEEAESEELFNDLVLSILKPEQDIENPNLNQKEQQAAVEKAIELAGKEPKAAEPKELEELPVKRTYRGFLYIRCDHCGERKAFCAKEPMGWYRCSKCGERTELEAMAEIYVECECGKRAHYVTNMIEPEFDIDCIDCGNPVAVHFNEKKGVYETIK